ncbi:MAG: SDR family NAD(P)-dependent oxidoreductase [Xanthomonadaceae bacterium]|nr:SDR family NAD(P)-dependent oxidoreductase [Xanthomonadaceae bacterium]
MNILITGITTGFGFITTKKLLKNGHTLLSPVRGGWDRLKEDLDFVQAKQNGKLIVVDLDLTNSSRLNELKFIIETQFKFRLDVLIHNAGLGILMPFELQNENDIRQQFDVNFFAPLEITRLLLPALRFSKGKIICVSSVAGLVSIPFYSTYCASKYALEAWAESLSSELSHQGIPICLVEPGGYVTEFANRSRTKMKFEIPNHLKDIYQKTLNGFHNMMESKSKAGQNPIHVANRIVKLAESPHPKFRNIMGIDAWFAYVASRILPRETFRKTISLAYRFLVNRFSSDNARVSE